MAIRLHWAILGAALGVFLSWIGYLTAVYWYVRFAGTPSLANGAVVLGHATGTSQLVWIHCNDACRANACKDVEPADAHRCRESLRASINIQPVRKEELLLSEQHVRTAKAHTLPLTNATVIEVHGLQPCKRYSYRASVTSTAASMQLMEAEFRTAPAADSAGCPDAVSAGSAVVRMLWGSCLGISPFSDLRIFRWLLERDERTDMVLLLGDTVYIDIPALEPWVAYAQMWNDSAFSGLFRSVPFAATYDDHELLNDWSLSDSHDLFATSMQFFDEWVGSKNPPPSQWDPQVHQALLAPPLPALDAAAIAAGERDFELAASHPAARPRYFNFSYGSLAHFFVLDGRQYATPMEARGGSRMAERRTKIGRHQMAHLKAWLLACPPDSFKFLGSSTAWSARAWKVYQDGWAAYRHERDGLFDWIVANNISGVVLLSADLHWAGVFHLRRWNLPEITVSPLQSFGLPAYLPSDHADPLQREDNEYLSTFKQHAGQLEIHAPDKARGFEHPWLNVTVFKYAYDKPRRDRSIIYRLEDMTPGAVNRSSATHEYV